jgi:IS30 family transposase
VRQGDDVLIVKMSEDSINEVLVLNTRDDPDRSTASIEDRAVPCHCEGDLISGSKNSHITTLVERHTRSVMLTWDRGKEMADHKDFTLATDFKVYFCDPQSP